MPDYIFQLGDIVSVKTHPYFQKGSAVIISGEPLQLPPLMIITEIFQKRASLDIDWTNPDIERSCKCLWYSSKFNKFQSDWMSSQLLKVIIPRPEEMLPITNNMLVALRSIDIELGKKKSTLTLDEGENRSGYTSITSLLSYLSPIMQVTKIKIYEAKKHEPIGDSKGLKERIIPTHEAKCIWFNSGSEKFSEVVLPIEALLVIVEIPEEVLHSIQTAILGGHYYKIDTHNQLIRPQSVTSRSGRYILRAFDFVYNSIVEIPIHEKTELIITEPFLNQAPTFDSDAVIMHEKVQNEILSLIKNAKQNQSFLRLQYKNRNDKVTIRTIQDYQLQEIEENVKKVTFLTGYCFLRREQRTFRLERIQKVQELNLSYEI